MAIINSSGWWFFKRFHFCAIVEWRLPRLPLRLRLRQRRWRGYAHHFNGWLNKFPFLCKCIDMLIYDYYFACAFHVHIILSISDWNAIIMAIQRCKLHTITRFILSNARHRTPTYRPRREWERGKKLRIFPTESNAKCSHSKHAWNRALCHGLASLNFQIIIMHKAELKICGTKTPKITHSVGFRILFDLMRIFCNSLNYYDWFYLKCTTAHIGYLHVMLFQFEWWPDQTTKAPFRLKQTQLNIRST